MTLKGSGLSVSDSAGRAPFMTLAAIGESAAAPKGPLLPGLIEQGRYRPAGTPLARQERRNWRGCPRRDPPAPERLREPATVASPTVSECRADRGDVQNRKA